MRASRNEQEDAADYTPDHVLYKRIAVLFAAIGAGAAAIASSASESDRVAPLFATLSDGRITIEQAMSAAIAALVGVVSMFWRTLSLQHRDTRRDLSETRRRADELSEKVARLEGEHAGVRGLAAEVLKVVADHTKPNRDR